MRRLRRRRGQSLVELALLAPILFLLLFGLFDLGDAVYTYNTLAHGAQSAALYASLHCAYTGSSYTTSQLSQQVLQAGQMLQAEALSVSPSPASGAGCSGPGSTITVTATYRYQALTPVLQAFFPPGGLRLHTRAGVLAQ